jgi:hypothetical protein
MMNDKPKTNLLAKPPPVQGLDFARKQEAGVIIANNDKNDKRFTIEKYKPAEPLLPGQPLFPKRSPPASSQGTRLQKPDAPLKPVDSEEPGTFKQEKFANMPRPMTPISLSGSGLNIGKPLTQQLPCVGMRDYYRDNRLFEVLQNGILEVGKNR